MQSIVSYLLALSFIFVYDMGEGQKRYRCFDPISHKLYVSHHVFFLEHIPFFSIPIESHNAFKYELVYIDPF